MLAANTSDSRVMGVFANGPISKVVYWSIGFLLISLNLYFVIDFVYIDDDSPIPKSFGIGLLVGLYLAGYLFCAGLTVRTEIGTAYCYLRAALFGKRQESVAEDSMPSPLLNTNDRMQGDSNEPVVSTM